MHRTRHFRIGWKGLVATLVAGTMIGWAAGCGTEEDAASGPQPQNQNQDGSGTRSDSSDDGSDTRPMEGANDQR